MTALTSAPTWESDCCPSDIPVIIFSFFPRSSRSDVCRRRTIRGKSEHSGSKGWHFDPYGMRRHRGAAARPELTCVNFYLRNRLKHSARIAATVATCCVIICRATAFFARSDLNKQIVSPRSRTMQLHCSRQIWIHERLFGRDSHKSVHN